MKACTIARSLCGSLEFILILRILSSHVPNAKILETIKPGHKVHTHECFLENRGYESMQILRSVEENNTS